MVVPAYMAHAWFGCRRSFEMPRLGQFRQTGTALALPLANLLRMPYGDVSTGPEVPTRQNVLAVPPQCRQADAAIRAGRFADSWEFVLAVLIGLWLGTESSAWTRFRRLPTRFLAPRPLSDAEHYSPQSVSLILEPRPASFNCTHRLDLAPMYMV